MPTNLLIDHLPAADRRRLLKLVVPVPLRSGAPLAGQDEPARGLLFPVQGCVALVTRADAHAPLQVGLVGQEGAIGAQLLLGPGASPVSAVVQQDGLAWSLPAARLGQQLAASPALRRLLMHYLLVQLRQAATAAACLHFHPLRERLARWLLMWQDRAAGDGLAVTHENMAQRLGVRRVGVTVAAGSLQAAGLVRHERGWIAVTDRSGLEGAACACYAQDRASYRAAMGFAPAAADVGLTDVP